VARCRDETHGDRRKRAHLNILLIEDDPTDMRLFSIVLSGDGHSVCEKNSAEQALPEIRQHRPELILLDLRLPRMDGLALIRQLKADIEARDIPIVAVTAAPEHYTREAAFTAGCNAYLVKPVDTRTLTTQVETVLRAAAAGRNA